MKMIRKISQITEELMDQAQNLQNLASQASQMEDQLREISVKIDELSRNPENAGDLPQEETGEYKINGPVVLSSPQRSAAQTEIRISSNIIPFPELYPSSAQNKDTARTNMGPDRGSLIQKHTQDQPAVSDNVKTYYRTERRTPQPVCFLALPGGSLPSDIPDYRPLLQRDGLILLAWDKRITESGEFYTAYWVTSTGTPRFFASRLFTQDDFFLARADHKSYAAEDGIEFYGQDSPIYLVHVAPELMMSNPRHGELRQVHIETLKRLGSELDFNYRYLLSTEKKRNMPFKKSNGQSEHRVDA